MRRSDLMIGLVFGLVLPATTGCDSGDDGSGSGGTVASATNPSDDGGDDGDGSAGTAAGSGTGGEMTGTGDGTAAGSDEGPIDPTEGEVPPEITCGDGVHDGPLLIGGADNPDAQPIETLNGISVINGDLIIDSTNYFSLDFLHCLTEIRGDVQIFGNYFLVDLSGTDGIVKIGRLPAPNPTPSNPNFIDDGKGSITISSNPALVNLNGFAGIVQVGEQEAGGGDISPQSLVIRTNDALETLTGFANLELIYQSLIIQENPVLKDIDGLASLAGVGGSFSVTRNDELCISSVNAIGGSLDYLGDPEHSTTTGNNNGC